MVVAPERARRKAGDPKVPALVQSLWFTGHRLNRLAFRFVAVGGSNLGRSRSEVNFSIDQVAAG